MIDELRNKIKELQLEREKVILQKGLAAQFNGDLRENSEYDSWEQLEINLTSRIRQLILEIEKLTKKPVKIRVKKPNPEDRFKNSPLNHKNPWHL